MSSTCSFLFRPHPTLFPPAPPLPSPRGRGLILQPSPRTSPPRGGAVRRRGAAMAALRAALLAPLLALCRAGPGPAASARVEVAVSGPGDAAGVGDGTAAGPGGSYTLRGALLGAAGGGSGPGRGAPREEEIGGRLVLVRGRGAVRGGGCGVGEGLGIDMGDWGQRGEPGGEGLRGSAGGELEPGGDGTWGPLSELWEWGQWG